MNLQISRSELKEDRKYVDDQLYYFNREHLPGDLAGRFEVINVYVKDGAGKVRGGILSEVCWNWLGIDTFILDEDIRGLGYGSELLKQVEAIAVEKDCDFVKVDTLSFQALDFYKKHGYEVFGTIDQIAGGHKHYYLKKNLRK